MYSKCYRKYETMVAVDAACIKHHAHDCSCNGGNVTTGNIRNEGDGVQVVLNNSPIHVHVHVHVDDNDGNDNKGGLQLGAQGGIQGSSLEI